MKAIARRALNRAERRAGVARNEAYSCHGALTAAVLRCSHPRRIAQLHQRAIQAWERAARLHARVKDWNWRRVALWHRAALRHGVLDAGAPVPLQLPLGIDEPWPEVPSGGQWLYRAGLPHYGCGSALLLDGSRLYRSNGVYK